MLLLYLSPQNYSGWGNSLFRKWLCDSEPTSCSLSPGQRQTIWKISPPVSPPVSLSPWKWSLGERGMWNRSFGLFFPLRCSFLPLGDGISSFGKVELSVFSWPSHLRPECNSSTVPLALEGPSGWKKKIFSCLGFQIAHGKRIVTAHRRCFTNLFCSSKRDFLICFSSLEFVSLKVFLDPWKCPWNESSLSKQNCAHTHAPARVFVLVSLGVYTHREIYYFPKHSFFNFFFIGLVWFFWVCFPPPPKILTKRCFKVMAWKLLNVNLSTLWC